MTLNLNHKALEEGIDAFCRGPISEEEEERNESTQQ